MDIGRCQIIIDISDKIIIKRNRLFFWAIDSIKEAGLRNKPNKKLKNYPCCYELFFFVN